LLIESSFKPYVSAIFIFNRDEFFSLPSNFKGVDPEIELAMGSGESSGLSLCSSSLLAAVVAAAKENVSFYILSMLKNNSDYCWTMKMK